MVPLSIAHDTRHTSITLPASAYLSIIIGLGMPGLQVRRTSVAAQFKLSACQVQLEPVSLVVMMVSKLGGLHQTLGLLLLLLRFSAPFAIILNAWNWACPFPLTMHMGKR